MVKSSVGRISSNINELEQELQFWHEKGILSLDEEHQVNFLKLSMEFWYDCEEMLWSQKARQNWLLQAKDKEAYDESCVEQTLNNINLPKLSDYHIRRLNRPISNKEIEQAVSELKADSGWFSCKILSEVLGFSQK
ncbi:hypothetical protein K1719_021523 [Acacia pycnantha]|nr:hypothetical protein K1719_021523 [Acacia pycnantha]